MAERRLTPDEAALWRRVMASVRPAHPARRDARPADATVQPALVHQPDPEDGRRARTPVAAPSRRTTAAPVRVQPMPGTTLDGSWDKKLRGGTVAPDSSIDLHGHTLETAHAVLDRGLADAIARGDRVLLLITGKPPRPESERPHARGRIRAALGDWLAASRHARDIAAVREAHPRHGGSGALYIVLRRGRSERKN